MIKILLTLFFMLIMSSISQAKIKISFGVYSSDKPSEMVKQFRPVMNYLEVALSKKLLTQVQITTQVFANYDQGISAIAQGQVDFARLGPASYVFAKHQQPKLSILAVENQNGRAFFYGVIAIAEDSRIDSVKDLKGRSFSFGNKKSTIGRYLSQNLMIANGVKASDLKNYSYLGRHDKVGMAVAAKAFDAGALKESTFNRLVADGRQIKKLVSFKNVTKPWIASHTLNPTIRIALIQALLSLDDSKVLKSLGKSGFSEVNDSHFDITRNAILNNKQFFAR